MGEWVGKVFKNCNSFVADTQVLMADGSHKAIQDVQVGDEVVATDPTTGETGVCKVTALSSTVSCRDLVSIVVDVDGAAGDKTSVVTATDNHEMWVDDQGRWLDAKDLKAGDDLRTADSSRVEIAGTATKSEYRKIYNFTVDGLHTYYLRPACAADAPDVMVHNSGMCAKAAEKALDDPKRLQHAWRHLEEKQIVGSSRFTVRAPHAFFGGFVPGYYLHGRLAVPVDEDHADTCHRGAASYGSYVG